MPGKVGFLSAPDCISHINEPIFRREKRRIRPFLFPFPLFSALQLIFLFFLQENELRKALIPFIGVGNDC
jgi:hypothetical protein